MRGPHGHVTGERGHFRGPPPALLLETEADIVADAMLGADEIDLRHEFGANQARHF